MAQPKQVIRAGETSSLGRAGRRAVALWRSVRAALGFGLLWATLGGCLDTELASPSDARAAGDSAVDGAAGAGGDAAGTDAGACTDDDQCVGVAGRPVCAAESGRCVPCQTETQAGCGAEQRCCEVEGVPACVATSALEGCEACGVGCGAGADTCQERVCVCGATGAACGGATPLCRGGVCIGCVAHSDCGPDALCCAGACQITSLEACTDCGAGCGVDTASACEGRTCRCGGLAACAGDAGRCLTDGVSGQSTCVECADDADCTFDATRTQCVGSTCRACDPMDHAGCVEASTSPICGPDNTCVRCQSDGQCELRPGTLDRCQADGGCVECAALETDAGHDEGCNALAPICTAGVCRPRPEDGTCTRDLECAVGRCADGRCGGCNPLNNAGCGGATPICGADGACVACAAEVVEGAEPGGPRQGDTDCNRGAAEGARLRVCTAGGTCAVCDPADHHGCDAEALCCPGVGGAPTCVPAEPDGANGCETCGVACDGDRSNACVDRQCVCDVAGVACAPPQLCAAATGQCQGCRDNADCPLDSQCCNGLCLGTGPTAANLCTGCFVGPDSCNELASSVCEGRTCRCGNNPACDGDRPVCDDVLANGLPNPNRNQHLCVACLVDAHCDGQVAGGQCVNRACVACDADPLAYDGCDERSAEPICVNGRCRPCASSLDCQVRPGNLDQCDAGECVECLVVAPGEAAPGCNIGAPICDNNVCRPCAVSAECGAGRECVGGSCESCDPNGDVGCGGTQPICDDGTLRCRACAADNECPAGSICTPGDGRCVACDLASHRGCNNNQLCCGALPGQSCVALTNDRCTSCNNGACNPNTANRCAPRTGTNTVGSCDCGPQDACSGALAFCDGNAPNGGCVGCRADGDCVVPGLTQCVTNGSPANGADPALCRVCDPDVAAHLSGCDFNGTQPFCRRIGDVPNQQVVCRGCVADADCLTHPSGSQCVASGACRLCDPANGANSAGCILSSAAPYCGNNFTCRGCANDSECAAIAGNGNLCHEATGVCFACNDGVRNGTETGLDCGGPDCPNRCPTNQGCAIAGDCVSGVCTGAGAGRVCQAPTCVDGVRNGTETGVDCGGGNGCNACANGLGCAVAGDCQSGVCIGNICQAPGCFDGVRNGAETGVDCGGGTCSTCPTGQRCSVAADCVSGVCSGAGVNRVCQAPTCNDAVRNGNETATDCGGGTCPACANGLACVNGARDCQSGVCPANNLCAVPTCIDGVRNGTETGLDCGGGVCPSCPAGQGCANGQGLRDCQSATCIGGLCVQAGCNDGIRNNGETDIDCGGPCGATCQTGDDCEFGERDCVNKRCVGNLCAAAVCAIGANPGDLLRNGNETDIDCGGGGGCNACADGRACVNNQAVRDCLSRVCTNSVCQVPTCNDGQRNGGEVGVDCRGPCPALCPTGQSCTGAADCASGVCTGNLCQAPTCVDGVRNGNETDIDCGGGTCPACVNGRMCSARADCANNGYCNDGVCAGCQPGTHNNCGANQLCCRPTPADNYLCRGTTVNGTVGCTDCTVGCDLSRTNQCTNRGCRCGANAACAGNLFCVSGGEFGAGQCRECRNNPDCGGATPACVSGTCQVCNAGNDFGCAGGTPECLGSTQCVECIDNGDCGGATPACVSNVCRRCDTADDDGCAFPTPQCDNFTSCVECLANGDCVGNPDGNVCSGNTCVQCTQNVHCNGNPNGNVCSNNLCVQCVDNSQCGGATPICVANTCQ